MRLPPIDNRSCATRTLRKGDRVIHPDYGLATVVETVKKTGATVLKFDDNGPGGTCSAEILKRVT
jgi:hypothetical protein